MLWMALLVWMTAGIAACSPEDAGAVTPAGESETAPTPDPDDDPPTPSEPEQPNPQQMKITVTINGRTYAASLEDNAAARAFLDLLPLELEMTELNGNEKYADLPQSLPTATFRPGTIRTGDLLLWGSSTVVLFYETFSSSYSYTRLGRLDDPSGLAGVVGSGNVRVTFARP